MDFARKKYIREMGDREKVGTGEQDRERIRGGRKRCILSHSSSQITSQFFPQHILVRADLFLFLPFSQELADTELAMQEMYQDHFAYSILLELVLWYLFLEQELHGRNIVCSQVLCNSIQQ